MPVMESVFSNATNLGSSDFYTDEDQSKIIFYALFNNVKCFINPADISLLKVNNRNTRTRFEIC